MIVTLSSVRGAPGVSSWALLIAAAWPSAGERALERVVLEADLDGGVYGARYGFGVDPGVSALAAAVRREHDVARLDLNEIGRHVADRVWLIPGPESAELSQSVWGSPSTADAIAAAAATDRRLWIVDAGRARPGAATYPLVERAQLSVLVCRPTPADLVQVPSRVVALQRSARAVGVLVTGKCDYPVSELGEFLGTGLVWQAPDGKDLVSLSGAVLSSRRARHSWSWRAALDVAGGIAEHLAPSIGALVTDLPDDLSADVGVGDG